MLLDEWKQFTPLLTLPPKHWIFALTEKHVNCIVLRVRRIRMKMMIEDVVIINSIVLIREDI